MTHSQLIERAQKWLRSRWRCRVIIAGLQMPQASIEQPDAIGWTRAGHSILVECKLSVGDAYQDRRKPHRRDDSGPGMYRWVLAPDGVLYRSCLERGWGLAELREDGAIAEAIMPVARSAAVDMPWLIAGLCHGGGAVWLDRHSVLQR